MNKYICYLVFILVAILFSIDVNSQIVTVLPSNGTLTSLRNNNGTTYSIKVTGSNQGSVWGGTDGIYTDDSSLAKAAVHAGILKVGQQAEDYGLFQIKMLPDWKFDQNATDKNTLTFKHYVNGEINYNVRIIQNPTICSSSKDFNAQVRKLFDAQYKKGDYVDKFKPNSEYNFLGHSGCHMMTYINKESDHRAFNLNAFVNGKRYSVYIFDYKSKKNVLRQEVIDFIEGISLSIDPKPFVVENKTNTSEIEKSKTSEKKNEVANTKIQATTKTTTPQSKNDEKKKVSNPESSNASFQLGNLANIPPSKHMPFLDITTISKTEWDGAVSAAMEGMRLVYGPMTAEDDKKFVKSWAPLRQTPFKEAVDYLNKFNPLLGEFLTYRTSITQTGILLEEAVKNAGVAAEYDDPQLSFGYLDLATKYRNLLVSRQKRLQQITNEFITLGNTPDGMQMMAEQQRQYNNEKEYLKSMMAVKFEQAGCWAGYRRSGRSDFYTYPKDFPEVHTFPLFIYTIKISRGGQDAYVSIDLKPDGNSINTSYYNFESDYAEIWHGPTWLSAAYKKFNYPNIPEFNETSDGRYQGFGRFDDEPGHPLSNLKDWIYFKHKAKAFFKTATKWAEEGKWETHVKIFYTYPNDLQVEIPEEVRVAFTKEMNTGKVTSTEVAKKENQTKPIQNTESITDRTNSGVNYLHLIDDKKPEDRKKIDTEAIEFHNVNIASIQKNISLFEKQLAEGGSEEEFQRNMMGAQANMQHEKDRIATIQTGIIVHNRSPWDDYAKSNFIQNIAENQQKMENISRGIRKAYETADRLPNEEARKVRNIINDKYSGKIMANLDQKAAREIIEEANSVGKKYFHGKIDAAQADRKVADEETEWADTCLQTAEIVKTTADYSMMGLSMFGGKYINNAYQGITGYIEGGPKEAFLRVAGSYNTVTGVAVDGFRGFEDAVNKGGDFVDGFLGAGWEVTKGLITDKAMSYGAGKISGSFNRPNGNLPNVDGSAKTGQGAATNSNTVFQKNISRAVEPDFNRPLTTQEIAVNRQQVADGRNKVNSYKKTFEKLETARKAGAPATEIKQILVELDDRSAKIHSSPQAKMIMKTLQKQPKNLDMIKRYSNSMDRVHQKVEKRFQAEMQKSGWSPEELEPIRNKPDPADLQRAREAQARGETFKPEDLLGSKTVNMDYDAGRKVKLGADGKPVAPVKNGKSVPIEAWHAEAQASWEKAYLAETGQSPTHSWENITHGKLGDAYADLNVLQKNGILHANKQWAGQTADVSYYKAEHLRGSPEFQRAEKYVEIARGTSKDCRTKMMPLFEQKKPKEGTPSYKAWLDHKNYWEKVNGVLNDMGSGKKDALTADREIREITGGKSVLEVTFDMRNFMESLMKLGNN